MPDRERIIKELHSALESVAEDDNPNGSVAVKIWAIRNCLEIIEKCDDMIPIKVVAYFLADYAFPPTDMNKVVFHESKAEMEWEQFLLDLKGRKNRND